MRHQSIPTQPLKKWILPFILMGIFTSCSKKVSDLKSTPEINYSSISANTMRAGSNQAIDLVFSFSDGDGDLGVKPSSGDFDIFTMDSRDTVQTNYYFPQGLVDYIDPQDGLSGICTLSIEGAFLALRPDHPDGDTMHLDLYIKDRAGHKSNHISTPDIYLTP